MPVKIVASDLFTFTDLPTHTADGYYVGFSQATVIDGTQTFSNFNLLCDDFGNVTDIPSGPWTYHEETLSDLSGAMFTQSPELTNYKIAAILLYEYNAAGGSALDTYLTASYQFALWDVFTPSAGTVDNSAALLTAARNLESIGGGITSTAYAQLEIFTPVGQAVGNQEFLALDFPGQDTPEPATSLYIGAALLALYGFMIRGKKAER